jgi:hypothetical protein
MNLLVRDFMFLEGSCNFYEDYLDVFHPKNYFLISSLTWVRRPSDESIDGSGLS